MKSPDPKPTARIRSQAVGGASAMPFAIRCAACAEPVWIDAGPLEFTFVDTWEPSLIVTEIYAATARCVCGEAHHVERHLTNGYGGAREELFAGVPTDLYRAALREKEG